MDLAARNALSDCGQPKSMWRKKMAKVHKTIYCKNESKETALLNATKGHFNSNLERKNRFSRVNPKKHFVFFES
jgi:hypothetical protein